MPTDASSEDDVPLLTPKTALSPPLTPLSGTHVTLRPLHPDDASSLYTTLAGPSHTSIWKFLPDGPYSTPDPFATSILSKSESPDPLFFTILNQSQTPVGHAAFMRMTPAHLTIELGNIIFSDTVHRSVLTTEAIYLMLRRVFDELGYRRCEWKCDDRNLPSKKAAERFGFRFEGVFRQHMVIKGRNRDTAWFSIVDGDEWEWVKAGFENWLDESNFDEYGRQRRGLRECRGERIEKVS